MNYSQSFWGARLPIFGIVLGLLGISYLSIASFSSIDQLQNHAGRVNHTHDVRFELEQTMFLVRDAQASARGYAIAGTPEFLLAYHEAQRQLAPKIAELAALVADNPVQVRNVALLKIEVEHLMALLEKTVSLRRNSGSSEAALTNIAEGSGLMASDGIRSLVTQMQEREAELLIQREQRVVTGARDTKFLIVFGTIAAYVVFGGTFWILAREVRQRKRSDQSLIEANSELQRRAGELEQVNKELETFSYSVSHDLRSPLRSMDGFSLMLIEDYGDKLDEEGKDALNRIRAASQRMGDLIDDMLRLSKVTRGEIKVSQIDLTATASEIADALDREQSDRSVQWEIEPGLRIRADPALIRIAMQNLLQNAWKFTGRTEEATIRVGVLKRDAKTVYFVADNGVGFDMAHASRLFDAFQRLPHVGDFPGTGIGLAIVQRIVRRHEGKIWAEAKVGEGATFFFTVKESENGSDEQDYPAG